jgi:hypothetical protein
LKPGEQQEVELETTAVMVSSWIIDK